jgi:pimeloyl-ACP methyl ester carboxylesterase
MLAHVSGGSIGAQSAGDRVKPEAAIVLVHGAWHGGWCYRRVADLLRGAGHRVYTPTLTGLGERSHLLTPSVNLTTHIADITNMIRWEDLRQIILVGHSYGGIVVTGVADEMADRISALVYLDAFLPTAGKSFHDIVPAELAEAQVHSASASNGQSVPPIPAAAFNVNEADRTWADSLFTPHPLRTLTQPIELSGNHARIAYKSYVLATKNPIPLFQDFARSMRNDPACNSYELPCGHDVMIDLPMETAAIIQQAAARAVSGS